MPPCDSFELLDMIKDGEVSILVLVDAALRHR